MRHRARRAVIVCPPSLALKWQDEMRDRFGLEFTIVNSELMAKVRRSHGLHANPFLQYTPVIVSMAWLPQVRAQRLLRDVYAQTTSPKSVKRFAFDALIVDEAHHAAPSSPSAVGSGRGDAVDAQRTVAVRQLADKCKYRLFLSATTHNLSLGLRIVRHMRSVTSAIGSLVETTSLRDDGSRRSDVDRPCSASFGEACD